LREIGSSTSATWKRLCYVRRDFESDPRRRRGATTRPNGVDRSTYGDGDQANAAMDNWPLAWPALASPAPAGSGGLPTGQGGAVVEDGRAYRCLPAQARDRVRCRAAPDHRRARVGAQEAWEPCRFRGTRSST
jgi:hypothetical protein